MLQAVKKPGQGWSTGYSIMSILVQLQSFLFEKFYDEKKEREGEIKKAVEKANNFKCCRKNCKHGGKLSCWPAFDTKEATEDSYSIHEPEEELFRKELLCYHTKLAHKENPLGLGLTISRIARTGLIKQANPCLDYVSLKAFIKEGIREASNNEKFTSWLPLFFGDERDRTLHLAKKAVSMICTGNTKHFKETMVLDLFPKILLTLSVMLMNEKRHASINILRIFCHVHFLYLTFLEEYPALEGEITNSINAFIKDEANRHKDVIQSLGAFQTHFIIHWDRLDDAIPSIQTEQFDRQVFWLLKNIPEMEEEGSEAFLDDKRSAITFKSQQISYQVLLFWTQLSRVFKGKFKSIKELNKYYGDHNGRLTDSFENEIQQTCFKVLKVESYEEYFQMLGQGKVSDQELNKRLKSAISNSKRRKYHGTDDEILALPSREEQIKELESRLPRLADIIDTERAELKEVSEKDYRQKMIDRYMWIKELLENHVDASPQEIAELAEEKCLNLDVKSQDPLVELRNREINDMNTRRELENRSPRYDAKFGWRELFIKLSVEDMLSQFDHNPDFKLFYTILKSVSKHVPCLLIPLISVKNIKSGYHYITAVLSNLTALKSLQIVESPGFTTMSANFLKAFGKGFTNFLKAGGLLKEIRFGKFQCSTSNHHEVHDKLFNTLIQLTSLETVTIDNNNLFYSSFKGSKAISKMILTHKNLRILNLTNCNMAVDQAKDIADGLMRAKQLEVLNISKNNSLGPQGLTSIIYNLAFSPKLRTLDISGTSLTSNLTNLTEALYKLLRISASLEILNLSNCGSLNAYLPEQFFVALGEVRTLKSLDLANSGRFNSSHCTYMGKAIAFNARKDNSLEFVNFDGGVLGSYSQVNSMFEAMNVSEADHETWYGDSAKVSKMSGNDFEKVFYNNLRNFQINGTSMNSGFNHQTWKKGYNPQDPALVKFLARSKNITNVQLKQCSINEKDADLLALALDPTRVNFASKIQVLNLSRNNLKKEGAKILSTIFEKNNILQVLDVSHNFLGVSGAKSIAEGLSKNKSVRYLNIFSNKIDVDGARAFGEMLKVNSTIEYIDFGHNRIRDEGLSSIAKGISTNKNSAIKQLGLRFNFLTGDGIISFLKKIFSGDAKAALSQIYLKNNSINEFGLYDIQRVHQKMNLKLSVDIFDKFKRVDDKILERTVWIHPASGSANDVKTFFQNTHKCGIVLSVRKRTGPKWPNRKVQSNTFYFVEFATQTSVTRALHVASRKQAYISGTNCRIFKAGSGTYNFTKQKKRSSKSKTSYSAVSRKKPAARGRGRGRR
jgi:Ran GTPase-activating protein (RanGAP) involved in mRNA processing and transport